MVIEMRSKRNGKEIVTGKKILLGDKEVHLKFTMPMWYRMEDEVCILDDVYTMMGSKGRLHEDKIPLLISIMSGGEITPKEVIREADPATMKALINEAQIVIGKAITMKEKKYDDDSIHDEVLEEIEKKDPGAS